MNLDKIEVLITDMHTHLYGSMYVYVRIQLSGIVLSILNSYQNHLNVITF